MYSLPLYYLLLLLSIPIYTIYNVLSKPLAPKEICVRHTHTKYHIKFNIHCYIQEALQGPQAYKRSNVKIGCLSKTDCQQLIAFTGVSNVANGPQRGYQSHHDQNTSVQSLPHKRWFPATSCPGDQLRHIICPPLT